jgi:hypothetical protein
MTHQDDYTFTKEFAEKGLEAIPEMQSFLIDNEREGLISTIDISTVCVTTRRCWTHPPTF